MIPWSSRHRSERALQSAVTEYLAQRRDILWTVTDAASSEAKERGRRVRKGWLDITIVVDGGRAVLVELKAGRNKLTAEQAKTIAEATRLGAVAVECRSVGEVHRAIERAMG